MRRSRKCSGSDTVVDVLDETHRHVLADKTDQKTAEVPHVQHTEKVF